MVVMNEGWNWRRRSAIKRSPEIMSDFTPEAAMNESIHDMMMRILISTLDRQVPV